MKSDNFNSDNETPETPVKDHSQEQKIKTTTKRSKINLKFSNSKSLKKAILLNNKNDINKNLDVNQIFVAKPKDLSYFSQFNGFFNKKFNLTSFKKEKEESRSLSKSPKKLRLPHQIRGNGIPNNIIERLTFLKNFFESQKFKKVYAKCPKNNESTFDDLCNYILNYSKKNGILNAILLSYYFICHEIKYDYDFKERNQSLKISQEPENVYESGFGLSLGFTNIFEAILKKLDIRFMHIEGYCKYLPKENKIYMNNLNTSKKANKSLTMYNKSLNSSRSQNSSKNKINNIIDFNDLEEENINDYINHCWNSFWFKGQWYLVDTLMGSGSVEIENKIEDANQIKSKNPDENFNIFYLLSWPNYLIYSHFPSEDNWQMSDKIWTFKQFLNKNNMDYPYFYKGLFQYKVELLTHKDPFIQVINKDNLIIKIKIDEYIIDGNLYNPVNGQKISEVKFTLEQNQTFILEPTFPKAGDYILRINLRATDSTDLSYRHLLDYRIKVINNSLFNYFEKYSTKLNSQRYEKEKLFEGILPKINLSRNNNLHRIITDYKKIFPPKSVKKVCYDTDGFYLFEPRSGYIRKGTMIKFKVKIKGVLSASLLDGNKFTNLKRTDKDIYEGQKIIETENVSICCLRGKNLFTEVFKFKPRKNKYDFPHFQTINNAEFKKF